MGSNPTVPTNEFLLIEGVAKWQTRGGSDLELLPLLNLEVQVLPPSISLYGGIDQWLDRHPLKVEVVGSSLTVVTQFNMGA